MCALGRKARRMIGKKEYGIGILGCGFIGKVHAYCHTVLPYFYEGLPFRSRLAGVCTSREETAQRAKDELGFEFCTTHAGELIGHDNVDIVHVCTPNSLHREGLLAILKAGKHAYCDKPLTATAQEAREVVAAMEDYGGTHQMTLQYRFLPATIRAKQLAEEGFLGDLTCFRAVYLHSGSVDPNKQLGWKLDSAMGGGVLNDLASHVVDLMQHLVGPFEEVFCASRVLYPERPSRQDRSVTVPVEAEDHVCLTVRRADGFVGTIEASKIATGAEDELRFEIHGTRGAMAFNLMDPNWLYIYDATAQPGPVGGRQGFTRVACVQRYPEAAATFPSPKGSIGWLRSHVACLYNFMTAVHEGRPAEPNLRVGANLNLFMEAAKDSGRQGRFVKVPSL